LLAARVQSGQESFHPGEVVLGILPNLVHRRGQLIEHLPIQRGRTAKLLVSPQQTPLLPGHAKAALQFSLIRDSPARFRHHLFLQPRQPTLKLALAPGQTHRGGSVAQIVQNRPANVWAGIGREGCPQGVAIELRRADQPQQAHLDQILSGLLAPTPVVARQRRNEVAVGFHQSVAAAQGEGEVGLSPVPEGWGTGMDRGAGVHGFSVFKVGQHRASKPTPHRGA
jgi:hypothetical protein